MNCRHCKNKILPIESGRVTFSCKKCMYMCITNSYNKIISEVYISDKYGCALIERECGKYSCIYEFDYQNKENLTHFNCNTLERYLVFYGFKNLEFHRNRLNTFCKSMILK